MNYLRQNINSFFLILDALIDVGNLVMKGGQCRVADRNIDVLGTEYFDSEIQAWDYAHDGIGKLFLAFVNRAQV